MTALRPPVALAVCLLALPLAAQPPARPERLTFDQLYDEKAGREASGVTWAPDGRRLTYVWEDDQGEALWLLDLATGRSEPLLRLGDKAGAAGRQDNPLELAEHRWSPRGDALLILSGEGDLYLFPLASRELRRLTATEAEEEDPKLSPDGSRLAFVRDFDLHLLDLATGRETALTQDGEKNVTLNGVTDWVYWEELWNRDSTGHWWSPDGKSIAYYRFDETPVGVYPLVDDAPTYPEVEWQKYPKAGEPNPRVQVGVLDLASGRTVWMATGRQEETEEDYLVRVDWTPGGEALMVQRLNREQTRLALLRCRPRDGRCDEVLAEERATWVNVGDDYRFLPDGRLLWGSERDGWRRIYLYGADFRLQRALSPAGWAVSSLDAVTAGGRVVMTGFETAGMGPARRQVLRVPLDGGAAEPLAAQPGWNEAEVAPATGAWVHGWSDADTPRRAVVRRPDGSEAAVLPFSPLAFDPATLPKWEYLTLPGPDGVALPARMLRPTPFTPGRRYPAIVHHYGSPGGQVVVDVWGGRASSPWYKLMAQRGFAVLLLDSASSPFFGKQGEDREHRRFSEVNLAAQLAGVDYLKRLGWVDPGRIGLWGWSGGGANTLYCVLNRPGVWKAAVAGAPVTDWRLYDSIWTERYLDHPRDNADGYRDSSPVTHAANLKDRLLIVHGTADDNVHPQNTIVLTRKWIDAGIPFEELIYPGEKHGLKPAASRHFYERMTEFFERTLNEVMVEEVEVRELR